MLTDLSKAFDCIPHDLIIAKLEAYGLYIDELKLIKTYARLFLSNSKQMVKVKDAYSLWKDIFNVVPLESAHDLLFI